MQSKAQKFLSSTLNFLTRWNFCCSLYPHDKLLKRILNLLRVKLWAKSLLDQHSSHGNCYIITRSAHTIHCWSWDWQISSHIMQFTSVPNVYTVESERIKSMKRDCDPVKDRAERSEDGWSSCWWKISASLSPPSGPDWNRLQNEAQRIWTNMH